MGATAKQKRREQALAAHRAKQAAGFQSSPKGCSKKAKRSQAPSLLDIPIDEIPPQPLTLRDEARFTGLHDHWTPSSKLRHTQVSFVKSTNVLEDQTLREEDTLSRESDLEDSSSFRHHMDPRSEDPEFDHDGINKHVEDLSSLFVIDTVGNSDMVKTGMSNPKIQSPSPVPSDSSEEVILFRGRNPTRNPEKFRAEDATRLPSETDTPTSEDKSTKPNLQARYGLDQSHPVTRISNVNGNLGAPDADFHVQPEINSLTDYSFTLRQRADSMSKSTGVEREFQSSSRNFHPRQQQAYQGPESDLKNEMVADYMANMRDYENLELDLQSYSKSKPSNPRQTSNKDHSKRELQELSRSSRRRQRAYQESDLDDEVVADYMTNMRDYESSEQDPETHVKPQLSVSNSASGFAWSSDDIRDLGDMSTSSEMVGDIGRVYSKRKRTTGVQYLVVGQGLTPDDACWIQSELLTSPNAIEQIRLFEENHKQMPVYSEATEDSDPIFLDDYKDIDNLTSSSNETDVATRATRRMTDEQLAHRLAKQEELGFGGDGVIMFDGKDDPDRSESDTNGFKAVLATHSRYNLRSGRKRPTGEFPSATAFADALTGDGDPYDAFDIMDRDRPSITPKSKKKHALLDFALSDEELEANLNLAWEKDRQSKKSRKQQREEMRSLGLLGRKSGKAATVDDHTQGASFDAIKEHIKSFHLSDMQSVALPPMSNHKRLMVHQLCYSLGLTSKSQGVEPNRFSTLFKVPGTPHLDGFVIDQQMRHFPKKGKRANTMPQASRLRASRKQPAGGIRAMNARSGMAAASYRDGDIVGATAPEIGVDNKGRAMLEKMGWSLGTALGAPNNKGILQPVAHTVKNSKAGLG